MSDIKLPKTKGHENSIIIIPEGYTLKITVSPKETPKPLPTTLPDPPIHFVSEVRKNIQPPFYSFNQPPSSLTDPYFMREIEEAKRRRSIEKYDTTDPDILFLRIILILSLSIALLLILAALISRL